MLKAGNWWVLMSVGKPSVINSFSDVLASWSSLGRHAFCTTQCWCLEGAWWEVVPRPQREWCRCCTCPFAQRLTPPWAVPQGTGVDGMGRWSMQALGARTPPRQTSQDCGRRTGHLSLWANLIVRRLMSPLRCNNCCRSDIRQTWTRGHFCHLLTAETIPFLRRVQPEGAINND